MSQVVPLYCHCDGVCIEKSSGAPSEWTTGRRKIKKTFKFGQTLYFLAQIWIEGGYNFPPNNFVIPGKRC